MTALHAFNNLANVRNEAIVRVAAHAASKGLTNGALSWDGQNGSTAGVLSKTSDPADWESTMGLATWVAYALDTVTTRMNSADSAIAAADLLNSIELGTETRPLAYHIICRLLDGACVTRKPEGDLVGALATVKSLQARRMRGEEVVTSEWKAARRGAQRATDSLVPLRGEDDESLAPVPGQLRHLGYAIEAACYDAVSSPMAISEVLRQWLALEGFRADEIFGWTLEDDAEIRRMLSLMHQTYRASNPDEKRDVFQLLEEYHPKIGSRLKAYTRHGGTYATEWCKRTAKELGRLIREAKV
jgi:hypothetical protein